MLHSKPFLFKQGPALLSVFRGLDLNLPDSLSPRQANFQANFFRVADSFGPRKTKTPYNYLALLPLKLV